MHDKARIDKLEKQITKDFSTQKEKSYKIVILRRIKSLVPPHLLTEEQTVKI